MQSSVNWVVYAKHASVGKALDAGDLRQAVNLSKGLISEHPDFAPGWSAASYVAYKLGSLEESEKLARQAAKLDPQDITILTHLASCLVRSEKYGEAVSVANQVEQLNPQSAQILDLLGNVYSRCLKQKKAEKQFSKAAKNDPLNANYRFNLAAVQRFNGRIEEAEESFDQAIKLNPDHFEAYYARSHLRKQMPENNHLQELQQRLQKGISDWRGEVNLRYALGKEFEDICDWDQCFENYALAAKLKRSRTKFDPNVEVDVIRDIIKHHTRENLQKAGPGYSSEQPIFVLGLPRTGTTLVERILSSHSDVCSLGEPKDFVAALMENVHHKHGREKISRPDLVMHTTSLDFQSLGKSYLDRVHKLKQLGPRFIDKMPINYLYLGLICTALPQAKIILLDRHPMDACFAIFKAQFNSAYPWSYDLDELTDYYIAYHALMKHWRKEFPDRIFDVRYEELVSNQKQVTSGLLRFCDLDWQDQCLEFHTSKEASTTASATQVRKPLYNSSIGKWKNFRPQLANVYQKLIDAHVLSQEV